MKNLIFIIFIICSTNGRTANLPSQILDSNWKTWNNKNNNDTTRLNALKDYINSNYLYNKPDSVKFFCAKMHEFAKRKNLPLYIAHALYMDGLSEAIMAQHDLALSKINMAITYYEKANNKKGIAKCYQIIGLIFNDQNDNEESLRFLLKALKVRIEAKDFKGLSGNYIALGNIYLKMGKDSLALDYFNKSIELDQKTNNIMGLSNSSEGIGSVYYDRNNFEMALKYYLISLDNRRVANNKIGISASLNNVSASYSELKKYDLAERYGVQAVELAFETNSVEQIHDACKNMYTVYKELGKFEKAMEMFEKYVSAKDSLTNLKKQKLLYRQELKFEFEKKAIKDSVMAADEKKVKDAQIAQQRAEIKTKNNQQYMLFGGLGLVIIFTGFIFNRFRITQKQKNIIEEQKHIVEEKNKEITDSISYSKRIQAAILPPNKLVKEFLPDSFILYKPKDIVAGDFYWMEKKENKLLFAACDCTGHGVPGAMVSVVCNNGLNRAVREYGLTDPGKILDKTREIVIQEFEKSEEEVKDGMDISLVALENNKLKWAGANNPLWIIRNGELMEFKPNKQPIGKYADASPFTTHEIVVQKGDTLYVFTDGFQDQFGGSKGKKFKATKFKEHLLSIQNKSMEEQKITIGQAFELWKNNLEQNDDVCVIGVRI